ncbi:BPSL0067 family protein [Massilia sp. DWR3-1-1]|uniref:BPSL0067 family protein n=1 Tax=Massilia sp. DWR3-1-1 TaxID=2804559 RepID=UPI003CEE7D25
MTLGTITVSRNQAVMEPVMPYVNTHVDELLGKPLLGDGECVQIVKMTVPGLVDIGTMNWKEGEPVLGSKDLQRGTAIATFTKGRFSRQHTGPHAALFLAYAGATRFYVMEQHTRSRRIASRRIRIPLHGNRRADGTYPQTSNNALAFSVIEQ